MPVQASCQATSYTVPQGAVSFWKEHLEAAQGGEHSGVQERFGAKFLRFRHPAGLLFEVVEDATDKRNPWTTKEVSKDVATRGFLGAVLSVRDVRDQESFFVEALGFWTKTGVDGPYHRFEIAGGWSKPERWIASRAGLPCRAAGALAPARRTTSP